MGHIKREMAAKLAPILDKLAATQQVIQAKITGRLDAYSTPAVVDFANPVLCADPAAVATTRKVVVNETQDDNDYEYESNLLTEMEGHDTLIPNLEPPKTDASKPPQDSIALTKVDERSFCVTALCKPTTRHYCNFIICHDQVRNENYQSIC